jgi:hypothetical protein
LRYPALRKREEERKIKREREREMTVEKEREEGKWSIHFHSYALLACIVLHFRARLISP